MTFWVGLSVSRQKELAREVQTLSVAAWTASLSGFQTGPAPCLCSQNVGLGLPSSRPTYPAPPRQQQP